MVALRGIQGLRGRWLAVALCVSALVLIPCSALAGRNAGGALIVHTNDAVNFSPGGDYCWTQFDNPGSCENAITRTDKDEDHAAVIWVLAAFPADSSPAVTAVQFGLHDNLPEGNWEAWGKCGPGVMEIPDTGWPTTGKGTALAYTSARTELLFPVYWFAADGFATPDSAYLGTTNYTRGDSTAEFADNGSPPITDHVTNFGTVRWYAEGSNDCPAGSRNGGSAGGTGGEGGNGSGGNGGSDQGLDGDGQSQWVANRVLVRLREDLPMPPRNPVQHLGISSFDAVGTQVGLVNVQRVIRLDDRSCANFPKGSHLVKIQLPDSSDEMAAVRAFRQLPEVVWAQPDYVYPAQVFSPPVDPQFPYQWYMLQNPTHTCRPGVPPSCCNGCDIGIDTAWQYSRGNPNVEVAFLDSGADMQNPDLFNVWARNPDPREDNGDGIVELCSSALGGDINGDDADSNGYVDDVLLGWNMAANGINWEHPRYNASIGDHGSEVAGILGAMTNNNKGIASVAGGTFPNPGVRLIQFSFTNHVVTSGAIESFYYARKYGARIYSSSSRIPVDATCCFPDGHCEDHLTPDECTTAGGRQVGVPELVAELADSMLFIQASGDFANTPMFSDFARLPGVMAVGGYDCHSGGRWIIPDGFGNSAFLGSDYGRELSVVGPADDDLIYQGGSYSRAVMASSSNISRNAYSCSPDTSADATGCLGGTSASAPIVASVAALIFSYAQDIGLAITPSQVRKIIERTAEDIQCDEAESGCACGSAGSDCAMRLLGRDPYTGYGRVDAGRAFSLPVAALNLSPYGRYMVPGERAFLTWEYLDLQRHQPEHFELDYWNSENPVWIPLSDSLGSGVRSFLWDAPDSVAVGSYGYFRLTVFDDSTPFRENIDYCRYTVQDSANTESVESREALTGVRVGPNPMSRGARIQLRLAAPSPVHVYVYDVGGRRIRRLLSGSYATGPLVLDWDGRDDQGHSVASGIYFVRVEAGSHSKTVRLVRIR